jgi:hypothetical protein
VCSNGSIVVQILGLWMCRYILHNEGEWSWVAHFAPSQLPTKTNTVHAPGSSLQSGMRDDGRFIALLVPKKAVCQHDNIFMVLLTLLTQSGRTVEFHIPNYYYTETNPPAEAKPDTRGAAML